MGAQGQSLRALAMSKRREVFASRVGASAAEDAGGTSTDGSGCINLEPSEIDGERAQVVGDALTKALQQNPKLMKDIHGVMRYTAIMLGGTLAALVVFILIIFWY